jgi:quinol-cytochrome oxidoreductase complex cytochrome b subunit
MFISDVLWLGYLGGQPANEINIAFSQFFTVVYFSYFLILLPFSEDIEKAIYQQVVEENKIKAVLKSRNEETSS